MALVQLQVRYDLENQRVRAEASKCDVTVLPSRGIFQLIWLA